MYPHFIFDLTEVLKATLPTLISIVVALIVLYRQLKRNREMQAEGTFFNLLNSIRGLVANTEGKIAKPTSANVFDNNPHHEYSGVKYFYEANRELQERLEAGLGRTILDGAINQHVKDTKGMLAAHKMAIDTYNKFFEDHLPELAQYYRFTFNVLNFVRTHTDIPKKKKIQYINFVQSHMADSELQLLYYNGIGKHGKKYYDLIEEYNFLQNISVSGIIDFLEDFYPKSTFRL
jgi:oligoribonuclease (3'-5' exoribonuclease)